MSVSLSTGRPGLASSALCRAANGATGAGGARLVITVRLNAESGGRVTLPSRPRASTLSRLGATSGAVPATGAEATMLAGTRRATRDTGRAVVKSFLETTVTAPGTL